MCANKISFDDRVKPKNVLALNEKVAAIRRYETDPVYKSVGRYFNCSPDQIKRIIKQKDAILKEWNNRTKKSVLPSSCELKSVKVSVLGKAVHEWIRRMMYYSDFNLTDALIQTMAIEFKKALGLLHFIPDDSWVTNFRNTYNLKDVNTKSLNIGYQESHSVQVRDILRHLKDVCGNYCVTSPLDNNVEQGSSCNIKQEDIKVQIKQELPTPSSSAMSIERLQNHVTPSLLISQPVSLAILPVKQELPFMETITAEVVATEPAVKEPQSAAINSHQDAIKCVKQLEEFALLKENFRLIGLIERLEDALNKGQ